MQVPSCCVKGGRGRWASFNTTGTSLFLFSKYPHVVEFVAKWMEELHLNELLVWGSLQVTAKWVTCIIWICSSVVHLLDGPYCFTCPTIHFTKSCTMIVRICVCHKHRVNCEMLISHYKLCCSVAKFSFCTVMYCTVL